MALKPSGVVIELIETLGYTCLDEEIRAFAGDYFNVLMEGSALIDQAVMTLKKKTMSKEELAK